MHHWNQPTRFAWCLALAGVALAAAPSEQAGLPLVDFRYSHTWWQSLVCLPDDPDKPVVGKEGQFFFDFGRGGARGFTFSVSPQIEGGSRWLRQESARPRAAVLKTWKEADGVEILETAFLAVPAANTTESAASSDQIGGEQLKTGTWVCATRQNVILIHLKNVRAGPVSRRPVLRIEGAVSVRFEAAECVVAIGSDTRLLASDGIESCEREGRAWVVRLPAVQLAAGEEKEVVVMLVRHGQRSFRAFTAAAARQRRDEALAWWHSADLPFRVIEVPDTGIQDMLDASVRNIWQAREIIDGRPAFHVGPTHYRCLWIADGAFLLETAAMLGRTQDARAGIDHLLSFQAAHGGFELKPRYWKEDGLVLWTVTRHALLTNDPDWLRRQWSRLERVVDHIRELRREAAQDPDALHFGLLPPGDVDGGIGLTGDAEYSNSYWCLIGLKSAIAAARWLGNEAQAANWQSEYEAFFAAFERAARRDLRLDSHDNVYLPITMANLDGHLPQRGQWAFCHAVYPGELFPANDPIVRGNLGMLRATKRQGLVFGTGWDPEGLWTYFASFHGHALLWSGRGAEAAQVLYDFANHAAPTRVWWEEQPPVGQAGLEVGDMPHNWASAEFIRLTSHLLALERGDELHLFEGLPAEWMRPGMVTRLNGLLTRFGPLNFGIAGGG